MHVSTETRKHALPSAGIMPDGPWPLEWRTSRSAAPPVAFKHVCMRPLPALHLIASFIPWTKVSPPLITCPSVGYFARYSEKTGANGEWDTLNILVHN